jgi:hypothetical protein
MQLKTSIVLFFIILLIKEKEENTCEVGLLEEKIHGIQREPPSDNKRGTSGEYWLS